VSFTFCLTRAATVSVKVFTIAGRLVRVLPQVACGFDYNQIGWDGLDKDGQSLANGVYLYKLDAQAIGATAADRRSASFRDKFIIHR
jgi:flagellar hook assembly protein FlgD